MTDTQEEAAQLWELVVTVDDDADTSAPRGTWLVELSDCREWSVLLAYSKNHLGKPRGVMFSVKEHDPAAPTLTFKEWEKQQAIEPGPINCREDVTL